MCRQESAPAPLSLSARMPGSTYAPSQQSSRSRRNQTFLAHRLTVFPRKPLAQTTSTFSSQDTSLGTIGLRCSPLSTFCCSAQNHPICDDESQTVLLSVLENSMARIGMVNPESASAEVKEIYEKTLRGKPGNAQKTLAHRPEMLKNFLSFYASVGRSLDRRLYELIY